MDEMNAYHDSEVTCPSEYTLSGVQHYALALYDSVSC